ncbi:importin subunit alpha-1 [Cimex lectularius]|uniref:Importin subunit alpha n=1 Tax=Cimex lectularius TaxID=79782 RepID=A0A8I6RY76_CIMLE|nr:importin subunit alpha-1 [Cimex lectularius]XP_024082561.1 importin subunit alpha-1 [Cimex lectularius]
MPSQENYAPNRLSAFKNKGKDSEELRRRRNEVSIELRKAKKDDQLAKRRNIHIDDEPLSPLQESTSNSPPITIEDIFAKLYSNDENVQLQATQAARKILSREKNPPIDVLIDAVPRFIEFLTYSHNPTLQFESTWALTNVASGNSNQTMAVVNGGAIPKFVALLKSPHLHIAEQAVWALGNIAGDGPKTRDLVLHCNAMPAILELIKPDTSIPVLRNIVWTLSNLCRNKNPPPNFNTVKICLPYLCKLLSYDDKEVLGDACWALSYLSDGTNGRIQAVVDTGIVARLVELLSSSDFTVLTPALRTVGNIVSGTDVQTDAIINAGGLQPLALLLQHPKNNMVKEAAWTISNITAGNVEQIEHVINANILPPLLDVLRKGDLKSQKEAAWAVTNLTSGGSPQQVASLICHGVIPHLCYILDSKECKIVNLALDALANILQVAQNNNELDRIALMVQESGGVDKIEDLQQHENEQIYNKCATIIDKYFNTLDEDDGQPYVPNLSNEQLEFCANTSVPQGGFSFQ